MTTTPLSKSRSGSTARGVALEALCAVDEGAFANLVLPKLLDRSSLERRDRDFATNLVYGSTRMRAALDHLIARFADRALEPVVRNTLRLGAYQLHWLEIPAHAAVSATVDLAPDRARGFVNAVLRRIAEAEAAWPDLATELSYPQWILDLLLADLGPEPAEAALRSMNEPPPVNVRADGYTQDLASQWVTNAIGAFALVDSVVVDVCAAPGGKATGLAGSVRLVVASDLQAHRSRLVAQNVRNLGLGNVASVVADGRRPAIRLGCADIVLVDAPCSGLGALRRRPDARWRIEEAAVGRLAKLQESLLRAAVALVKPGGILAYSVCTMTKAETSGMDAWLEANAPNLTPLPSLPTPWHQLRRGSLLLPQDAHTDAMYLLMLRKPAL